MNSRTVGKADELEISKCTAFFLLLCKTRHLSWNSIWTVFAFASFRAVVPPWYSLDMWIVSEKENSSSGSKKWMLKHLPDSPMVVDSRLQYGSSLRARAFTKTIYAIPKKLAQGLASQSLFIYTISALKIWIYALTFLVRIRIKFGQISSLTHIGSRNPLQGLKCT